MKHSVEPHDLLVAVLLVQSLMERRSDTFFQRYGLTGAQFNILNLLGVRQGKMDQAVLVDLLLVGKSSISIVLNRMVRDGLIKRKEHPKDRRQVVLLLTPRGLALWQKILPPYQASVDQIFGQVPATHRHRLLEDLKTLHDSLLAEEGKVGRDDHWLSHFVSDTPSS